MSEVGVCVRACVRVCVHVCMCVRARTCVCAHVFSLCNKTHCVSLPTLTSFQSLTRDVLLNVSNTNSVRVTPRTCVN